MKRIVTLLMCMLLLNALHAQTNFYALDTIQKVEVFFSDAGWDYTMDTAKLGSEAYVMADSVRINGVVFDSVGVRYKGNSSYDSASAKNPWHIELSHYKMQQYYGVEDIKLSNCFKDPSMIREVLAYGTAAKMMDASQANFAQLYVNGIQVGLYSNIEHLGNAWAKKSIGADNWPIIKCNPLSTPSITTKSNFRKLTPHDTTSYMPFYELKSTHSNQEVVSIIDAINASGDIRASYNIDRALWMLAFNDLFVNLDSYTGVFAQNHYAFKDYSGRYNSILWDLNMCYGGFPFLGSGNSSMNTQSIAQLKRLSVTPHNGDTYWPLLNKIYTDTTYLKEYLGHLLAMNRLEVLSGAYLAEAQSLQTLIDTAVQSDANKFYPYAHFQNGLTTDYSVGNYTVPGIQNLMSTRGAFIDSVATALAWIEPSLSSPLLAGNLVVGNSCTATVTCSQEIKAYCCYRFNKYKPFKRIAMYDDGLHGDGAAADHVYGTAFDLLGTEVQYYFIAEGNKVSRFLPEYAEHEYFTASASVPSLAMFPVRLSEAVANNTVGATNELGQYQDWVELYNQSSQIYSLAGCYLSDDASNLTKWQFPSDAIVYPLGSTAKFPIIWCDENSYNYNGDSLAPQFHANFRLQDSASTIYLSDTAGIVRDSMHWNVQLLPNQSWVRCFYIMNEGTNTSMSMPVSFGYSNCPVGLTGIAARDFMLVPNPASTSLYVQSNKIITNIEIIDITGRPIAAPINHLSKSVDVSALQPGNYIVRINGTVSKMLIVQ
jgi:hypothetical protein